MVSLLRKNGVCEIGLLLLDESLNVVSNWQSYISPYTRGEDIDELVSYKEDAMLVNGLSESFLIENGKPVVEVCNTIKAILNDIEITEVIGHNVGFDIKRVNYLLGRFFKQLSS